MCGVQRTVLPCCCRSCRSQCWCRCMCRNHRSILPTRAEFADRVFAWRQEQEFPSLAPYIGVRCALLKRVSGLVLVASHTRLAHIVDCWIGAVLEQLFSNSTRYPLCLGRTRCPSMALLGHKGPSWASFARVVHFWLGVLLQVASCAASFLPWCTVG